VILIDHNGYVHIAYVDYDQKIPRKNITAFRTGVKTRDLEANYADLKDIRVVREHSYYRITRNGARYEDSLAIYVTADHNIMIYQDVPCPKV